MPKSLAHLFLTLETMFAYVLVKPRIFAKILGSQCDGFPNRPARQAPIVSGTPMWMA
jgi:hypothetical protein